jgi:chromosome segregation ATPase
MTWIVAFLVILVVLGALGFITYKQLSGDSSTVLREQKSLESNLLKVHQKTIDSIIDPKEFVSRAQYEFVMEGFTKITEAVKIERQSLHKIEEDLETIRAEVESREVKIQELKGAKEEEAKLLLQISQEFDLLNQEAENLQSSLKESFDAIKKMETDVELTKEQTQQVQEFQQVVSNAVDRLQELTVEGQEVERRLKVLSQQYSNLEEEYTKLVEQQFT